MSRHAAPRTGPNRSLAVAAMTVIAAAVFGGVQLTKALGSDTTPTGSESAAMKGCTETAMLRISAAPEIAPVIEDVASRVPTTCVKIGVTAATPADVVERIAAGNVPDVWVPDAADWPDRQHIDVAATPPSTPPTGMTPSATAQTWTTPAPPPPPRDPAPVWAAGPSIASSPIVLATSTRAESNPDAKQPWSALIAGGAIQLAQPRTDAASRLALYAGRSGIKSDSPEFLKLAQEMIRLSRVSAESLDGALADDARGEATIAFPVSEQQLAAHVTQNPSSGLRPVIPSGQTPSLTYPWLLNTPIPAAERLAADTLLTALKQPESLSRLAALGFRVPGEAGPTIGGVEAGKIGSAPTLATADQQALVRLWEVLRIDMRMLAVTDVSGSMKQRIGSQTRMQLTQEAEIAALKLMPPSSRIGAWAFSSDRSEDRADHEDLVPIRALDEEVNGTAQRDLLVNSVEGLTRMMGGDTGLYDTVLAARTAMIDGHDPAFINSVVVLTDGVNDDSTGGIDLPTLLKELEAQNDPKHPVVVIMIGIGPDVDAKILAQIAETTGGTSYVATTADDIRTVLLRALLARDAS